MQYWLGPWLRFRRSDQSKIHCCPRYSGFYQEMGLPSRLVSWFFCVHLRPSAVLKQRKLQVIHTRPASRSAISPAALFVKVTAKIASGCTPKARHGREDERAVCAADCLQLLLVEPLQPTFLRGFLLRRRQFEQGQGFPARGRWIGLRRVRPFCGFLALGVWPICGASFLLRCAGAP